MGLYSRSTSSSIGEGRRSALESAPWFKSLGARKFDSSLRHPCVYYICYNQRDSIQQLAFREDGHLRQSLGGGNEFKLLIIHFFIVIIIRVLPVRVGLLLQGRKVAVETHNKERSHFNLNISAGGSIPYAPTLRRLIIILI